MEQSLQPPDGVVPGAPADDLAVPVRAGARRTTPDLALLCWEDARKLSARSLPLGAKFRLAPDAYFALRDHDEIRHFFLEADRSTEEHSRLVRKFRAYWWYL